MARAREASPESVREQIDSYLATIEALQAFISVVTFDNDAQGVVPGARWSIGRRMNTSSSNLMNPSAEVTPDCVAQRNLTLGYVAEAKRTLPTDRTLWRKYGEQLLKYDDDLIGWWTPDERIEVSCAALLIDINRAVEFVRQFQSLIDTEERVIKGPLSVIEFVRAQQVSPAIMLRIQWGTISDQGLNDRLLNGISVPIEKVKASYGVRKFHDSKPIVEHTMVILWNDIFNSMRDEQRLDPQSGSQELIVSVESLTEEMQRLYGQYAREMREIEFPRRAWIRDAMEKFVRLDLAERRDDDAYVVRFRRLKSDLIDYFTGPRRKQAAQDANQLPLFDASAESDEVADRPAEITMTPD